MDSEGLGGGSGTRVEVGKLDSGRSDSSWITSRPFLDSCDKKDTIAASDASQPAFWSKVHNSRRYVPNGQPSSFHTADAEDFNLGKMSGSVSLITGREAIELHRRSVKVASSSTGGSKRSRIAQMEVSRNESSVEDITGNATGLRSCPAKSFIKEKTQIFRQKNNGNGKRGDKRNGRVLKSRLDAFSLKNSLGSFTSVAGGGNFLAYGSKSNNIFDVTKQVDELPLHELLDGSYNCPSLVKDKGKEVQNSNENLLKSVRKAYSALLLGSSVHAQHSAEVDNNYIQKVSSSPVNIVAPLASRADGGKGDCSTFKEPASDQESCGRIRTLPSIFDSPLYTSTEILERLALPPSKELDSLLLDAVKPASSSRNNGDLRLGKAVFHRTGLPPFSWSHNSSGHSKSGPDAVKLTANRTTCEGRWVKVGNTLTPLTDGTCFLLDLKLLSYDHRLVPISNIQSGPSEKEISSPKCGNFTPSERDLSSSVPCSASEVPPAEYSVRLLAAAETLCEIATCSSKQNPHGIAKWVKKPSEKTMKACKLTLSEKSERLFVAPKAPMGSDFVVKDADGVFSSKKLKLSLEEKSVDFCHKSSTARRAISMTAPKSIRPSSSKLLRDSVPETKYSRSNTLNKSYMMPPPARFLDKGWSNQQKQKKILSMKWSPTASKVE